MKLPPPFHILLYSNILRLGESFFRLKLLMPMDYTIRLLFYCAMYETTLFSAELLVV